jgi:hypothetical protein
MGQGAMTAQNFEFAERLARINGGIGSAKTTLYVGPEDSYQVAYHTRGQSRRGGVGSVFGNALYPMTLALAILVGVVAQFGTRWLMLVSDTPAAIAENIDYQLIMDFALAMMLSSVIGVFCRFGIRDYIGLRTFGILVGMIAGHNLVHMFPRFFETLYSPAWVGSVINSTEANSLLLRGVSITF